jgi:hypothetical protein
MKQIIIVLSSAILFYPFANKLTDNLQTTNSKLIKLLYDDYETKRNTVNETNAKLEHLEIKSNNQQREFEVFRTKIYVVSSIVSLLGLSIIGIFMGGWLYSRSFW